MAAFERAKQKMAEKMNRATSSKYPAEFEQSCRLIEATGEGTEELVQRLKKHLDCFKGSGDMYVVEHLGEAAAHLASGLSSNSLYTQSLLAMAKVEKQLGLLEKAYTKDVEEKVIGVLKKWMEDRFKLYKKERGTLEKNRLDMDRAIAKAREKGDGAPELKVAEEARTRDHNAQMQVVQGILDQLPGDLQSHQAAIAKFLEIQHRLHSESVKELDIVIREIAPRAK